MTKPVLEQSVISFLAWARHIAICNNIVTTTVAQQNCHNSGTTSVTTTLSQQQWHNKIVTTTVSQQQWHNNSGTTKLSQQHCHNNSGTTKLSQQQWHNNSGTTKLSQQHCHNNSGTTKLSQQQCRNKCHNNSGTTTVSRLKMCDFSGEYFKGFLWVQPRHNCSPVASFANYVMTVHLIKVHLQTFLSIPNNS